MSTGVQKIFSEAAQTYEMINHLLTFGLDALFRMKAASLASKIDGWRWLDVCSGTGEMAAAMYRHAKSKPQIISSDFSMDMLWKAKEKPEFDYISQSLADSGTLPFKDSSFDLLTISYATRNLNPTIDHLLSYLKEFRRVLKPGGLFINLETSQPRSSIVRHLFHTYIRLFVKRLGVLISGSKSGYAYLSYTVPRFHNAKKFAKIIRLAGFRDVRVHSFLFGTFAIHQAVA